LNQQAKEENFYFFVLRFSIRFRLLLKRGAKVRPFFRPKQAAEKIYFSSTLPGRRKRPDNAGFPEVPHRFNFFRRRLRGKTRRPVGDWECKSSGIFSEGKG
jgi:hypothetical protein